jgi:hypothetical protein
MTLIIMYSGRNLKQQKSLSCFSDPWTRRRRMILWSRTIRPKWANKIYKRIQALPPKSLLGTTILHTRATSLTFSRNTMIRFGLPPALWLQYLSTSMRFYMTSPWWTQSRIIYERCIHGDVFGYSAFAIQWHRRKRIPYRTDPIAPDSMMAYSFEVSHRHFSPESFSRQVQQAAPLHSAVSPLTSFLSLHSDCGPAFALPTLDNVLSQIAGSINEPCILESGGQLFTKQSADLFSVT